MQTKRLLQRLPIDIWLVWFGNDMKLSNIIRALDIFEVPFYILDINELQNNKYCFAIVIPTDKLAQFRGVQQPINVKQTGVYIINCDVYTFYEASKSTNPEGIAQIEQIIRDNFGVFKSEYYLAFAVFSILHEIGHIKHLEKSKMTYEEYYDTYQKEWDNLYREYLFVYKIYATTPERIKAVNQLYGEKYRSHPFENFADHFALEHFEECMQKIHDIE